MAEEMHHEQMRSPSPSEAADAHVTELTPDARSVRTETPAAVNASGPLANKKARRPQTDVEKMRRGERLKTRKAINLFIKSAKGPVVAPKDRIGMLHHLREEEIAAAERIGMGSVRKTFPKDADEDEEKRNLEEKFAAYIVGHDAPVQVHKIDGFVRGQDYAGAGEVDMDDEEPEPIRPEMKKEAQEYGDGDEEVSGVQAGMAITRGFGDAGSIAVPARAKRVRNWKWIAGKWIAVPIPETQTTSQKRKFGDVVRGKESKKTKVG